jgi:hypothetical protein
MCEENKSDMKFNYALSAPYKFTKSVSDSPDLFQADICLECYRSVIKDVEIVIAVVKNRQKNNADISTL